MSLIRFSTTATMLALSMLATTATADQGNEPQEQAHLPEGQPDVSPVADDDDRHDFAMLFDPVTPLLGAALGYVVVKPELQFAMGDYLALDVMPAFVHYFGNEGGVNASGGGGHLGLRIVPAGTGLEGTYLVPRVGVVYAKGTAGDVAIDTTIVSPTLEVGYAWAFGNFVMNAGGGAGYAFTVDGYDVYEDSPIGGLQLVANFSIGFGL